MELYKDLGKAFKAMWSASDKLTRGSDTGTCSMVEHRLRVLQANFHRAEVEANQAEMLRLAKELGAFGDDLVALKKQILS